MIKKMDSDQFHKFLENKIITYNSSKVSRNTNHKPSEHTCYIYEENSKKVAGVSLEYYWGIMYIKFLWVDEKMRGKGIGEELLIFVENLAIKKKCSIMYLETFTFQAPNFYKKFGFEEFGTLKNIPEKGVTLYFMKKYLP